MPDNFDLHELTDAELTAIMVDLELGALADQILEEAGWAEVDPWLLDASFDE